MDDKFTKVRCISACCLALGLCLNALPTNVTEMTSLQPKVYKYIMFIQKYDFSSCTKMVYVFSSFWLLGVESRDFGHAKKERTAFKAEQINKMATNYTQNGHRLSFCVEMVVIS